MSLEIFPSILPLFSTTLMAMFFLYLIIFLILKCKDTKKEAGMISSPLFNCQLSTINCQLLTDLHFHALNELLRFHHQLMHVAVVLHKGNSLAEAGHKFFNEG